MDSGMDSGGSEEALNQNVDFSLVLHTFSDSENSTTNPIFENCWFFIGFNRKNESGTADAQPMHSRGTARGTPAPRPPVEAFLLVFLVFSLSLTTTRTLTAYGC